MYKYPLHIQISIDKVHSFSTKWSFFILYLLLNQQKMLFVKFNMINR